MTTTRFSPQAQQPSNSHRQTISPAKCRRCQTVNPPFSTQAGKTSSAKHSQNGPIPILIPFPSHPLSLSARSVSRPTSAPLLHASSRIIADDCRMNAQLEKGGKPTINNLQTDLCDGVRLLYLLVCYEPDNW